MNSIVKRQLTWALLLLCQFFYWQSTNAQNIQYLPLNTYREVDQRTIDQSLSSGATPAETGVTENGSATYAIPIVVPPGTNEVAPDIAIAYNSMGDNGALGQGWGIAGLSSISRVGQSMHFDSKRTPVNFTSSDRFSLDGMRLTLRTGSYGSSGSTYRKELDDFSVVTAYGSMAGSPVYFKIEQKDGTVLEYGNRSDARFLNQDNTGVLIWRINKISYPDGNYIQFYWTSDDRDNRIYEIKYTGNSITGQAPYNLIKFHYKSARLDPNTVYEAGSNMTSRYLLDRVEVKAESATVKNYYLRYGFDGYRSLLNSIQEKGSDGTALNSTIFRYGSQPNDFSTQSLSAFAGEAVDLFSGDFDGDGYTDILTAPYAYEDGIKFNTALKVYRRTSTDPSYSLTYNYTLPASSTVVNGMNIPKFHNLISSDFDGDGRDDIMTLSVRISGSQNWRKLTNLTLHRSTGTSFSRSNYSGPAGFDIIHPSLKYYYPGDFNGDGMTDYILFLSNGTGYRAFISFGGTTYRNIEVPGLGTGSYPGTSWMLADDIRVLDFDGDGKMELMKIDEGNTKIYTFNSLGASVSTQLLYNSGFPTKWHRIYFGDFNGDQKTDMLVRNSQDNNDGIWEKAISTGKGFVTTPFNFYVTPDITGVYSDDKLEIGDFNGDGKTDILHGWNGTSTSTLGMYYSRGDTYTYETENFGGLLGFVPLVQYDLNGDGRTDIINRTHFMSPSTILYFQKEGQELLLQNIVDGHNKKTNFFYRRMTQTNNFYSRDLSTDYPLNRVTAPIYLAHRLQQDNGRSGYFTTQYKYRNAFVLRTGKGFLGFQQFDAIDLTNDVRTSLTKKFPGIFLYTLVPDRLEKYVHSTNYKYNSVEYTQGFTSRPNKSFWLRTIAIREYLLLQSQVKLNSFTYDSHGNVTKEVELNGVETITTNSSYAEYAGTVPNRITEMTVLRERTGEPSHSFSDRYYYNSKGQMTSKIDYFGLPKQVVTDYDYNDLGNEISKTISAAGMLSRQTIKDYDSKGRFVTSLTNPMGYAESATYDIKWSTKLSVTGIDGLTSTFNYDAFGRRIKTTLPTGVVINETYPFFVSALYGSTYYHRISQTGKPDQWFYFDKLGRKVHYQRRSFDNAIINETWTYDLRGLLKTVRAPYKSGETTFTTTYHYDNYNRRTSAVNPYGTTTFSYSHSGGKSKITKTNPAGQVSTVEMDASGAKTEATDNGGTLTYSYNSQGLMKQIKLGSTVMVRFSYDVYGNKTQMIDKNAATFTYDYNPFRERISEKRGNLYTYNMRYNKLGRITRRSGPGEDRRYIYHTSGVALGKIAEIYNAFSIDRTEFDYDSFGRISQTSERIDGPFLTTEYTYNAYNDITSKTFPSGLKLDYQYDANGLLSNIKHLASGHTLFANQGMNGREQYTSYELVNGTTTTISYNQGTPTRYLAVGQQDLQLNWDHASGNLNYRRDLVKGRIEFFTYDSMNRLRSSEVAGQPVKSTWYNAYGNIVSKTDVGAYSYESTKNNAVTRVANTSGAIPTVTQDISYTKFDQPSNLVEGDFELDYSYSYKRQRMKSELKESGSVTTTRLYLDDFERQTKSGVTKDIHYINAGQGMVGMVVKNAGVYEFYSTYTDHLGSILRVTDESGAVVAEQNFDPWGRKRNASTWAYDGVGSVPDWLYRGYTGHEEVPEFQLINMNGRMYDPVVGRMLSVDNHIQSPTNTQSYNRYSYVFNNPLSYTDPNGELAWFVPVIIGAVAGAYAGASIASGGQWNFMKWEKDRWWKGAIVGAFVGAAMGALAAPGLGATGIKTASGSLTKAWKITTTAIKGANIKMGVTQITGGDLDKLYKAGLVGAALGGFKGAFKATKGFGLIKKWGWKATLAQKSVYATLESLGGNWINGDKLFYNVVVGVGPLRFTFGKKYDNPIFRWQDNIGSLLSEALPLLNFASGGDLQFDVTNLTLTSDGGWLGQLPELDKVTKSVGYFGEDWLSFLGQYFSKLGSS